MRKFRYEEMRPAELAAAREEVSLVYVPIGSIEYHGWHLPVGMDAMHAHALCLAVAEETGGVVLPATFWGTTGHDGFPGSLLLRKSTVLTLVMDVLDQLTAQGYRLIVLCTGHYPEVQGRLLEQAAQWQMAQAPGVRVRVLDVLTIHLTAAHTEHAGRMETSVMLYLQPELTDMAQLQHPEALHAISPDCMEATAEYGEEWFRTVLGEMVRTVKEAIVEGSRCARAESRAV